MTFTAKYLTIDSARAAAARSYENPVPDEGAAPHAVLQVGSPVTINQDDVDDAQTSLEALWKQVKEVQNF